LPTFLAIFLRLNLALASVGTRVVVSVAAMRAAAQRVNGRVLEVFIVVFSSRDNVSRWTRLTSTTEPRTFSHRPVSRANDDATAPAVRQTSGVSEAPSKSPALGRRP